jgi:hypothetical protein
MKPFTVIMQPHWAAHHLTRRAIRKYPDIPDTDNEAYLNLFSGVQNIMAGAAANGELKLIAYPLWWPIPAHMAVDEDGHIVQGAGITDTALYEWLKSFDADIIANKQSVDDFWKELRGDDASTEPGTVMEDGVSVNGCLGNAPFSPRRTGRPRTGGPGDETLAQHWQEIESQYINQGTLAIAQKIIAAHPDQYVDVTAEALQKRHLRKTGQTK